MNYCESCIYYNPMDAEEGFCDKKDIVVEYNECYCCHSESDYAFAESIWNGGYSSSEEFLDMLYN